MATGVSGIRSLYATFLGFVIGSVGGVIGGIWLGISPFFSRLLNPYIWAFNALPKVALDHVIEARAASGGA